MSQNPFPAALPCPSSLGQVLITLLCLSGIREFRQRVLGFWCCCSLDQSPPTGTPDTRLEGTIKVISLPHGTDLPAFQFLLISEALTPLKPSWGGHQCDPQTLESLLLRICRHSRSNLSKIKILETVWALKSDKPGFGSAVYLFGGHWASYFKSQNLSSLNWDPKVLGLGECCVHAHFRKIFPAAVWGMGWRGKTRDSSEEAEQKCFQLLRPQPPPQHTLHCDPGANLMLLPSNSPASPRDLKLGPHRGCGNDQFNYKFSGESCISSFLKYSLGSHQVPGPVLGTGDLEIHKT